MQHLRARLNTQKWGAVRGQVVAIPAEKTDKKAICSDVANRPHSGCKSESIRSLSPTAVTPSAHPRARILPFTTAKRLWQNRVWAGEGR
jgi:hypothetical protein